MSALPRASLSSPAQRRHARRAAGEVLLSEASEAERVPVRVVVRFSVAGENPRRWLERWGLMFYICSLQKGTPPMSITLLILLIKIAVRIAFNGPYSWAATRQGRIDGRRLITPLDCTLDGAAMTGRQSLSCHAALAGLIVSPYLSRVRRVTTLASDTVAVSALPARPAPRSNREESRTFACSDSGRGFDAQRTLTQTVTQAPTHTTPVSAVSDVPARATCVTCVTCVRREARAGRRRMSALPRWRLFAALHGGQDRHHVAGAKGACYDPRAFANGAGTRRSQPPKTQTFQRVIGRLSPQAVGRV
jgi:hypothetical protein